MNLIDFAIDYQSSFFPHIPWRTGRLATTGMNTDFYSPQGDNSLGFDFCNNPGLQYGKILNEAPVISYVVNGKKGSYINRHYMYFDSFFDNYANRLAMQLGGEIRVGE